MRAVRTLFIVSSLVVSILTTACSGASCPQALHTSSAAAFQSHRALRARVSTMRAEARVDQRGPKGRIRGTVMMFVARPERVRFDAMTQFGPAAILTSDGERFALTDLRENRYLEGPTCPANIARLLGIPMSGEDVMRLLLGDTPRIAAVRETVECTGEGTYQVVASGAGGERQEIELAVHPEDEAQPPSNQRLRLVRSELYDARGNTQWRATFDEHRVVRDPRSSDADPRGVAMPFEVRFEDPRKGVDTLVRFESVDLNVDVPADAFRQTSRPGIPSEWVGCD